MSRLPRPSWLLLAGLAACSGPPPGEPAVRGSEAIIGGKPSPAGSREDAVLMLLTELESEGLSCSAVHVAKNLVLTARHCVAHGVAGSFGCTLRGELLEDGSGAGSLGLDLPAESLEFYTGDGDERRLVARGAKIVSSLTATVCIDDLAFVVLDRDVDLPILPIRRGQNARPGEGVVLTGYGLNETMDFGTPFAELARAVRDDLAISAVGPLDPNDVTTTPPRSIVLYGQAGCVGDSGAPLYALETAAVLGVYSLLAGDSCTSAASVGLFAHVPAYTALIADAFAAAGAEPLREGQLGDVGETCSSKADCLDGVCAERGDGKLCTRSCARTSDCPSGFDCSSSAGLCFADAPQAAGSGGEDAGGAGGEGASPASLAGGASGEPSEGGAGMGAAGGSESGAPGSPPRATSAERASSRGCSAPGAAPVSGAAPVLGCALLFALMSRRRRAHRRPSSGFRGWA